MTTALAKPAITAEELDLVKKTVANGATDAELKLYLHDCARQGVHPLDRLVHFTKRGGKYTPVTSIDFMRIRAAETGEYAGSDDAIIFTDDAGKVPERASVTVWRLVQGIRCSFTATARWSEYKPEQNDFMWRKMPHTMLAKCAEALALRKGFPRQLAGLYAKEEMDQADRGGYTVEAPERPTLKVSDLEGKADAMAFEPVVAHPDSLIRALKFHVLGTGNRRKQLLILSDGREVYTFKEQMGALLEQLVQERCPIHIATHETKYGEEIDEVRRLSETQANAQGGEPLHADDIPF